MYNKKARIGTERVKKEKYLAFISIGPLHLNCDQVRYDFRKDASKGLQNRDQEFKSVGRFYRKQNTYQIFEIKNFWNCRVNSKTL